MTSHGQADPGDQSPARERHDHLFDAGELLDDLDTDCSLPLDDIEVVERVYERHPVRAHQLRGPLFGLVVAGPGEDHRCAGGADSLQLGRIHPLRHADRGGSPEAASHLRDRPAMVPRRGRDHPCPALPRGQLQHAVGGAAHLERTRALKGLELRGNATRARDFEREDRGSPGQRADAGQRSGEIQR